MQLPSHPKVREITIMAVISVQDAGGRRIVVQEILPSAIKTLSEVSDMVWEDLYVQQKKKEFQIHSGMSCTLIVSLLCILDNCLCV